MSTKNFIALNTLSTHYKMELSFFDNLNEIGLIEIQTFDQTQYVHQDSIYEIEKIIRMHQELDVNIEGIDVVFNLLQKIDTLKTELLLVRNRLRLYEN
ncbi:chaperone modulator CbpM [Flavobacterium sp. W1B]|uniref:chaperone modulator CbpM n=1 Tax=Flavobacterium sp. W1B TaxID=3394146 RepID=UPI0039BD1907